MKLVEMFTPKQVEVLKCSLHEKPKILIASGAKRAGKTFIFLFAFLEHVKQYTNQGVSFILGGSTDATIQRNVIDDLEKILGREIKLNKKKGFELWGNVVYVFGGANSDSWKSVRGFTAAGAFLNEGTALHDTFIKEVISRCSYEGARIFIDTNPENPMHTIKTDYIDKSGQKLDDGRLNIKAFHFQLYDNIFLPADYVDSIEKATPTGMFFDRDILGNWVSAEGVVYKDFVKEIHLVDDIPSEIEKYIGGIDYGYEHYGSIVVIAKTVKGEYYLIEEIAERNCYIDWWTEQAKDLQTKYKGIVFYCDHARPDYISFMRKNKINVTNANKSVIEGINYVGSLLKQEKLFFKKDKFNRGLEEMCLYCWSSKTGKEDVVKTNDDVLDALRYALFSESNRKEAKAGISLAL